MISFLLIIAGIWFFASIMNSVSANARNNIEPVKPACPPHSWSWQDVYNEDGSVHHRHLVCAKCGPLHGVRDE